MTDDMTQYDAFVTKVVSFVVCFLYSLEMSQIMSLYR